MHKRATTCTIAQRSAMQGQEAWRKHMPNMFDEMVQQLRMLSWCVRSDSLRRKECSIYLLAKCSKLWIGKARDFVPQEDGSAMCRGWMQIYKSKTQLHWQAKTWTYAFWWQHMTAFFKSTQCSTDALRFAGLLVKPCDQLYRCSRKRQNRLCKQACSKICNWDFPNLFETRPWSTPIWISRALILGQVIWLHP